MSTFFNHAMRYEWTEKTPIRLVRARRRFKTASITETHSHGQGLVCAVAGLAWALPLQSRGGLRVRISGKDGAQPLAFKRDVKTHPTGFDSGRDYKARLLARIQTFIRNASQGKR